MLCHNKDSKSMKYHKLIFFPAVLFSLQVLSQDIQYAKAIIDTLCSPSMYGRGYVNNGDKIAAQFISNEFKKGSLACFGKNYFQFFKLPVGTLPGEVYIQAGNNKMAPGIDYLVSASSPATKGVFAVIRFDSLTVTNEKYFRKNLNSTHTEDFILLDRKGIKDKKTLSIFDKIQYTNSLNAKGIILVEDKLVWGAEEWGFLSAAAIVTFKRSSLSSDVVSINVNIEQDFQDPHEFSNVIAYVKGKEIPDSFTVFTAHYDHLGQMGTNVYFPGANDNAGGVALMLDLAKYYAKNKPRCSVAFIALTGEEIGLAGSQYYVSHPLFSLKKIKFLINLDLVGTGDDGIKVVNGAVLEKEFSILSKINNENKYLPSVNKRGEAAISDHYPFYAKGVKAFYIYTLGGIAEYHNIYDKPETLPLTKYNELFKLLTDFVKEL